MPVFRAIKSSPEEYKMKFEIENQWLLIAKKNRKVAASFWLFEQARPKVIHPKLHKKEAYALAYTMNVYAFVYVDNKMYACWFYLFRY